MVPSTVSHVFEACRGCWALCEFFILISFASPRKQMPKDLRRAKQDTIGHSYKAKHQERKKTDKNAGKPRPQGWKTSINIVAVAIRRKTMRNKHLTPRCLISRRNPLKGKIKTKHSCTRAPGSKRQKRNQRKPRRQPSTEGDGNTRSVHKKPVRP